MSKAETTCCPINKSEFLPEINDSNKIASALAETCLLFPGNRMTGAIFKLDSSLITIQNYHY